MNASLREPISTDPSDASEQPERMCGCQVPQTTACRRKHDCTHSCISVPVPNPDVTVADVIRCGRGSIDTVHEQLIRCDGPVQNDSEAIVIESKE